MKDSTRILFCEAAFEFGDFGFQCGDPHFQIREIWRRNTGRQGALFSAFQQNILQTEQQILSVSLRQLPVPVKLMENFEQGFFNDIQIVVVFVGPYLKFLDLFFCLCETAVDGGDGFGKINDLLQHQIMASPISL